MTQMLNKAGIQGMYLHTIKAIHDKPTTDTMLDANIRNRTDVPVLATFTHHRIRCPSQTLGKKIYKAPKLERK